MAGVARLSGADKRDKRWDTGRKRKASSHSEATFLRDRRARQPGQEGARLSTESPAAVWTESHAKEMAFVEQKIKQRRLQAVTEGTLLHDEYDDADIASAQAKLDKVLSDAYKRRGTERRQDAVLTGGGGLTIDKSAGVARLRRPGRGSADLGSIGIAVFAGAVDGQCVC